MPKEVSTQDVYLSTLNSFYQTIIDQLLAGHVNEELSDLHENQSVVLAGAMFLGSHLKRSGLTVLAAANEASEPFVRSAAGQSGYTTPIRTVTVQKQYVRGSRKISGDIQTRDAVGLVVGVLVEPEPLLTAFEALQETGAQIQQIIALVCDPPARQRFISLSNCRCCGIMTFEDLQKGIPDE